MPARLTLHLPSAAARELILPDGEKIVVGRSLECGVVIDDDRVSRRHAALAAGPAGWTVADLGSKNGTLVDGRPLTAGPLPAQSWLSFGGLIAFFETVAGSVADLHEQQRQRRTAALTAQQALDPRAGLTRLLSQVVGSMLSLANAERGFLLLAGEDGEVLRWRPARVSPGTICGPRSSAAASAPWSAPWRADRRWSVPTPRRTPSWERAPASPTAASGLSSASRSARASSRSAPCTPTAASRERRSPSWISKILEGLAAQAGLALAVSRLNGELHGLAERIEREAGAPVSWQKLRAADPTRYPFRTAP